MKLPFSESLLRYCQTRNTHSKFSVGQWLSSLEEEEFETLFVLTKEATTQFQHRHMDVLMCVIQACQHEGQKMDEKDIASALSMLERFIVAVDIENLVRLGWIELLSPFSILHTETLHYSVTELGWANEESMNVFLH